VAVHRIAGVTVRTESNVPLPRLHEEPFESFRVGSLEVDAYQRICKVSLSSITLPRLTPDERCDLLRCPHSLCSPAGWESPLLRVPVVRARLRDCLERCHSTHIELDYEQIIIRDFAERRLDVFCMPTVEGYDAELYVASNFPRLFCTFLPVFSALLIHAAGVVVGQKAAVFLASDGGGKTTAVQLGKGMPVLHDDQVILKREAAAVVAHATPLGRNTSGPIQARLGGLFMLKKAQQFELVPLKPAAVAHCLWFGHQGYTHFLPKSLKARAFEVLGDACYRTPVYEMRFPKGHVDWDAIDAAMSQR